MREEEVRKLEKAYAELKEQADQKDRRYMIWAILSSIICILTTSGGYNTGD